MVLKKEFIFDVFDFQLIRKFISKEDKKKPSGKDDFNII